MAGQSPLGTQAGLNYGVRVDASDQESGNTALEVGTSSVRVPSTNMAWGAGHRQLWVKGPILPLGLLGSCQVVHCKHFQVTRLSFRSPRALA